MTKDVTKTDRACPKCKFVFGAVNDYCACPKCRHSFNASDSVLEPTEEFDFDQFQTANGLTLPESYVQFIREQDGETSRQHGGREWRLKSASQLNETVKVGGAGNKPFHSCVQLFIKLHLEFTGANSVQSTTGPIESDRVFGGFAFADDNANYLYLDPFDDFSVWLFHHDGADVELVARTFTDWLEQSRPSG